MSTRAPRSAPVGIGLIGCGAIGAFHAATLATRVTGGRLVAVADAAPGLASGLADRYGLRYSTTQYPELIARPEVEAVVIATPAPSHPEIIEAAAAAGRAVFCEKPIANDLLGADRAIAAVRAAGVPLQVGFQRRFDRAYRAARDLIDSGEIGRVQLLRSTTRDPRLDRPERTPLGAVFRETLVHDFDVLHFLNPGARVLEVFAFADALVMPEWKARGLLDTAVVSLRFDNGALATVDASFQAVYGYDVRAEVFGSRGMVTAGGIRQVDFTYYSATGALSRCAGSFTEFFGEAYVAELAHFVACVRSGETPACTGEDGRAALAVALAAVQSVESGLPSKPAELAGLDRPSR